MEVGVKQISSLEKIRSIQEGEQAKEINQAVLLGGETFSYQQVVSCDCFAHLHVEVISEISDFVKIYEVKDVVMDLPCYHCYDHYEGYITTEPGMMPDLLTPLEKQRNYIRLNENYRTIWIEINIPRDFAPGVYPVSITYQYENNEYSLFAEKELSVEVLNVNIPKQNIKVTQWFHTDCIADAHNVEIYSESHWTLIDQYMRAAAEQGINMILTPMITPPLDTEVGKYRPNTQLVKIEKKDDNYLFDFSLLKRWIALARKNGIEYFEMAHLFSQWGLRFTPSIYGMEHGREVRLFGWDVPAQDDSYRVFLEQFLPALVDFLEAEGIAENTYFHISDEPKNEHLEAYQYAYELVKPLIGGIKTMDALSDIEFYENGLVKIPVTGTDHIEPFLEKNIDEQWAYYCCVQGYQVANRFLSMPSYRNRILGLQLYKYGIKGFLQWGFNFYYSQLSLFKINPYVTTSADKGFPSGDAFSVYPGDDGPLHSLRAKVFKEAMQDISVCELLEQMIGKEKVLKLIESVAKTDITFSEYPQTSAFLQKMNAVLKEEIQRRIS